MEPVSPVGPSGTSDRYGFYTTRWVQALNPRQAERKALALLRKDPSFERPKQRFPWDRKLDLSAARIYFEEIERIARLPRKRRIGAVWFPESAESERAGTATSMRERLADRRRFLQPATAASNLLPSGR